MQSEQLVSIVLDQLAKLYNLLGVFGDARRILGRDNPLGEYLSFLSKALITGKAKTRIFLDLQKKAFLAALSTLGHNNLLMLTATLSEYLWLENPFP
jgi:hypothetical protein